MIDSMLTREAEATLKGVPNREYGPGLKTREGTAYTEMRVTQTALVTVAIVVAEAK